MRGVFGSVLGVALGVSACDHRGAAPPTTEGRPAVASTRFTPCGDLGCRQYASVEEAFTDAITLDNGEGPRVVAIGEAHAQKGAAVPSSASRFTTQLLPLLAGRASDLLVEILNPPSGCAKVTHEVRKKQETVTASQAAGDQNEYVAMGVKARALGIIPDLLRPTCRDLDAIEAAVDDAIDTSLRTIERLTETQVEKLLERAAAHPGDKGKMVVTYGGALHNVRSPSPERAAWSFGPALSAYTKGRYVEVDLYVPEFIEDTDNWRRLPFYSHYDRARLGGKTTLFRDGDSVVIVFPVTTK